MSNGDEGRATAADAIERGERRIFRRALRLGLTLFVVALLLLPTNFNPVLRLFSVPASSMAPLLPVGSYALASRLSYGLSRYSYDWFELPIVGRWPAREPARGDVVVFRLPRDHATTYVKRVVGLPGDRVQMVKGRLVLNGATVRREPAGDMADPSGGGSRPVPVYVERVAEGVSYRIVETSGDTGPFDDTAPVQVPPGTIFVLGDNRDNSSDSRIPAGGVGFVPLDHVIGRVVYALAGGMP